MTQQNAAMSEEASAAAVSLLGESQCLHDLVDQFALGNRSDQRSELKKTPRAFKGKEVAPRQHLRSNAMEKSSASIRYNVRGNAAVSLRSETDWNEF